MSDIKIAATTTTTKSLQSCPTLSNPMDCSLLGSFVHGILKVRVLEWGAIAFSVKKRSQSYKDKVLGWQYVPKL